MILSSGWPHSSSAWCPSGHKLEIWIWRCSSIKESSGPQNQKLHIVQIWNNLKISGCTRWCLKDLRDLLTQSLPHLCGGAFFVLFCYAPVDSSFGVSLIKIGLRRKKLDTFSHLKGSIPRYKLLSRPLKSGMDPWREFIINSVWLHLYLFFIPWKNSLEDDTGHIFILSTVNSWYKGCENQFVIHLIFIISDVICIITEL